MTVRLHHAVVVVADLERVAAFYEGVLGLSRRFEMAVAGESLEHSLRLVEPSKARSVFLRGAGGPSSLIELIEISPGPPGGDRSGLGQGLQMLSMEIDEDLAGLVERMREAGVEIFSDFHTSEIAGYGTIEAIVVRDPEGNLVEIVHHPERAG